MFVISHLDLFYSLANQNLRMYISHLSCMLTDNDDMESSKRVIFILRCLPKSSVIIIIIIIIIVLVVIFFNTIQDLVYKIEKKKMFDYNL